MKGVYRSLFFLLFFILNTGYSGNETTAFLHKYSKDFPPSFLSEDAAWADSLMAKMTLREKIAQSFILAAYSDKTPAYERQLINTVEEDRIGGFIFFTGGPARHVQLVNRVQQASEIPLFIAMDAEWGPSMRLDSTIKYPRQLLLGAVADDDYIFTMGSHIGQQLKRLGINMSFAPVIDINNNELNPVINSRSFGENRVNVAGKGVAYARGLMSHKVVPVVKHFPGHGDTQDDSHHTLPVIDHDMNRLDSIELFPFKSAIDNGIPAIMTAHLHVPALDSTPGIASTLSPLVIDSLLRNTMNFQGLVVTDALGMEGVAQSAAPEEVALRAYLAGNDILLMPEKLTESISHIEKAAKDGVITDSLIDQKCRRILMVKKWTGLDKFTPIKKSGLYDDLNRRSYQLNLRKLYEKSLTLVKNKDSLVPVQNIESLKIASLSIGAASTTTFQNYLSKYGNIKHYHLNSRAPRSQYQAFYHILAQYDLIIIGVHSNDRRPSRAFGIPPEGVQLIQRLAEAHDVILTMFANPYSIDKMGDLNTIESIMVAYENTSLAQEIAAQGIFGGIPVVGRLPVSVADSIAAGTGVFLKDKIRLSYTIPEDAGIDSASLSRIDSIARLAIKKRATPGCQVLVARDGKVIYEKAFGYHTYLERTPVEVTDLYDLASITKMAATTLAVMKLFEQDKFDIDKKLKDYIPYLDTSAYGDLKMADILAHQAGLKPWIPFYIQTIEGLSYEQPIFSKRMSDDYPLKLSAGFYAARHVKLADSLYSREYNNLFTNQVADNLYLLHSYRDSIYHTIFNTSLSKKGRYKYSDLGFYLFYEIIEDILQEPMYNFLYHEFYNSLGAHTLGYLPLNRFPREQIVPTEDDILFRKQLIHGHVHDPGAAMLGGISGHAGLFSNASDLAIVMQMLLQKGAYGGKRYLKEETVEYFTHCYNCKNDNRRGLGFDKPQIDRDDPGPVSESASDASFGHTGFTGTIAWADPDYNLVYIFLSNRIHPSQDNTKLITMDIRTQIQEVIYEAIKKAAGKSDT